jgi:hypothetical protein
VCQNLFKCRASPVIRKLQYRIVYNEIGLTIIMGNSGTIKARPPEAEGLTVPHQIGWPRSSRWPRPGSQLRNKKSQFAKKN